jgi:hypothetical protein
MRLRESLAALLVCGLMPILSPLACAPAENRTPAAAATMTDAPLDGSTFVVQHLAGTVDLVCPKATPRTVFAEIARQRPDICLAIDPDLANEKFLDEPLGDISLRQIPAEEAVRVAIGTRLDVVIRVESPQPPRIRVATAAAIRSELVTAMHPVGDILRRYAGTNADAQAGAAEALAILIKWHIHPYLNPCVTEWPEYLPEANHTPPGGEATCKNGMLRVRQSREGQAEVAAILAWLRQTGQSSVTGIDEEPPEIAAVRRMLGTRIDADFDRTPLDKALAAVFAKVDGLQWRIDPAVAAEGIDLAKHFVTVHGRQTPADSILGLILTSDVGYAVRPGYVQLTLRSRLAQTLSLAVYNTTKLLAPVTVTRPLPGGRQVTETVAVGAWDLNDLLSEIETHINATQDAYVAQWSDEGGAAQIQALGATLIVSQTRWGHEEVARFLKEAVEDREAKVKEYQERPPGWPARFLVPVFRDRPAHVSPEDKAVKEQLERPVNFQFADKPLSEALEMLRQALPDLNIVVRGIVEAESIDILARKVSVKVGNGPAYTFLNQIAGDGLMWQVYDGWVMISRWGPGMGRSVRSAGKVRGATYAVQDISYYSAGPAAPNEKRMRVEDLVDLIKKTVNSETDKDVAPWDGEHDFEGLQYFDGLLIVYQTQHGHQMVCACLNDLLKKVVGSGR